MSISDSDSESETQVDESDSESEWDPLEKSFEEDVEVSSGGRP